MNDAEFIAFLEKTIEEKAYVNLSARIKGDEDQKLNTLGNLRKFKSIMLQKGKYRIKQEQSNDTFLEKDPTYKEPTRPEKLLTDLQFAVLEIYSDISEYEDLDGYIGVNMVLSGIHREPKYFDVELISVAQTIKYLRDKNLIEPKDEDDIFHKITTKGTHVFFIEKIDREIKKNDIQLQRQLTQVSIKSNIWSPIFAGLAALFALSSIVIAGLDYAKSDEKLSPALRQIDTTLQRQLQQLHNLQQNLKSVQFVPRKDSL